MKNLKLAFYKGDHKETGFVAHLGYLITRLFQRGYASKYTHVEIILEEYSNGDVLIGSSVMRLEKGATNNGIRTKRTKLDPNLWDIVEFRMPKGNSIKKIKKFFQENNGKKYDLLGAIASILFGRGRADQYFCSEICAKEMGLKDSYMFNVSLLYNIAVFLHENY